MEDNTLEIRSDQIDTKEILQRIRENIRTRRTYREYPPDSDTLDSPLSCACPDPKTDDPLQRDLVFISSHWDVHNYNHGITSHRPYIGRILVKSRQIVQGEIRRYIDPTISNQTEFNARAVRILTRTVQTCNELSRHLKEIGSAVSPVREDAGKPVAESIARRMNEPEEKNERRTNASEEIIGSPQYQTEDLLDKDLPPIGRDGKPETHTGISGIPDKGDAGNYFLFEERFRGTRETITQRQKVFLPYFEKCSRVLDIGCGRGEFLDILKDHAVCATGVDSDPHMIAYCRSRQMNVVQSDAIAYLESLEDSWLDGIFMDQVAEHLDPGYLNRLLSLCYRKMRSNGIIIIETVNPLSFTSFANFYIDLTHKRPIHPETLHFVLTASGFRVYETRFLSPVPDEDRLQKMPGIPASDGMSQKNINIYNENIERLNQVLFGAQDYAVIARR
jgi:SAM-dependent methyltransferase